MSIRPGRIIVCCLAAFVLFVEFALAQPVQENLFTFVAAQQDEQGRPWLDGLSGDFWECMGKNAIGSTSARPEVEAIFQGNEAPDETFFNAAWRCGFFALAAPWESGATVEREDLGAPITYDTPGITALNQMSGRPPGIEQIADPSAVMLPDGRIALYFSGDHREAFQSARWITKEPVASVSDPIEFEIEADYNLPPRLLWRQMFRLADGTWRAFGNYEGIRSWESPDGLDWTDAVVPQTLVPSPQDIRDQLDLPQNDRQFNSFLNISLLADSTWVGVMPHYSEVMDSSTPDPNGNGYNDPAFVLIYHSVDGFTWNYRSVLIGTAEGFVTQLSTDVYMFTMSNAVFFSRDLTHWTFGHSPHFHTYGPRLPDGFVLHFETSSQVGIPLKAFRTSIDPEMLPSAQWKSMSWENMPTIEELRGESSGVAVEPSIPQKPTGFGVFPNPAASQVTVTGPTDPEWSGGHLEMVDPLGRTVWSREMTALDANRRWTIPVDELPAGVYYMRIRSNRFSFARSLLVMR